MVMLDERQEVLIRRQILRDVRRRVLSVMADASAKYGITLAQVAQGLATGNVPPEFLREWGPFARTLGLTPEQVGILVHEVVSGGQREDQSAEWDYDDLRVLVDAHAVGRPSLDQLDDVVRMAKRVKSTAARRRKADATAQALVRQALGIPEGEQDERR